MPNSLYYVNILRRIYEKIGHYHSISSSFRDRILCSESAEFTIGLRPVHEG